MTRGARFPFALVTVLCAACNGRTTPTQSLPPSEAPVHAQPSGHDDRFPDPLTYADALDAPDRDAWQKPREVVELLDVGAGMTTADLGVGTGYFLPYLSEAVGSRGQVLALDTERAMLELVEARIEREGLDNVELRLVLPDEPGLAPSSVDRILVVDTWHHITKRTTYARKLLAALRPGGLLLIVDFDMDSPTGPTRAMRLTPDTVLRELRAAGFTSQAVSESLPHQYVISARPR